MRGKETIVAATETAGTTRRDFLYIATGAMGAVGAAAAVWPFISQLQPDASVLALSSTEVDLSQIQEGQIVTVKWRGKPVFVWNRTAADIEKAKATEISALIDPVARNANLPAEAPATDQNRAAEGEGREKWLVVIGICTHLGCVPIGHMGEFDGWFCPCHGSEYDSAGRVRRGPAPENLAVPPYSFVSDTKISIG
ncbi:ubiquinol-cytochrome c reductase, iron-sulfur subunit [Ancylobacter novellus DSM 506]|uniref:Ubiquinol-cytochrome c reductase iron-sulfur subunit n=1 Tax=Ancylobacter novellus (strain ATCC 8093 / DSM 506 / JCM 20403 / CCM 1077 / IAM 12100 / NBRC 12443 / NCIMB 10456) TaxID=639283 RepID=D7A3L5_ANCN5|nr:ubiquinol-cytochrome c reductase, iron-sulfur subunit [Ancylobacter novellus DSM 506]